MAAYYRPITLDLGLNRGRERIVRDRERIVYVWKLIEKMDFDLGAKRVRQRSRIKCFLANHFHFSPQLILAQVQMSFIQPSMPKTKFQVNF